MLKVRTGYSFRQATGHLEEVISRLKEIGAKEAPITDQASTFGWVRWRKLAEKSGLRPVFGVELAVSNSISAKRPSFDHWLFIARDSVGPINRLIEVATQQFNYQACLSIDQAFEAGKEVNVIMGHRPQIDFDFTKPRPGVYVGLTPASVRPVIEEALRNKWPLAATSDNRYTREADQPFYEILVGRNASVQTYPQHLLSEDEWRAAVDSLGLDKKVLAAALANAKKIREASTAKLQKAELPVPRREASLKTLCERGAKERGINLKDKVYKERLARELKLIEEKGYSDYFYIVSDLCNWARNHMLVGPARGSSCGSLVCYLIGITSVDPIPHGLIFERFIDINRSDMPDIDIDFSDQQRQKVFEYLNQTYGANCVARLGAVAMFKPRSALQEAGGALSIPRWKTDKVADSIIERSSGDSRALNTLEDTLRETAAGKALLQEHPELEVVMRFEGHPRHYTQHAAGVVIASKPITEFIAIDHRTGAAMCDKKDAEDELSLLKIDALGLTQLSVFEDCLDMIGQSRSFLESIPLDDEAAFQVLNDGRFSGIFQFNGSALQNIVREVKVDSFNDIVSITALARPGPLASGGANQWVKRRTGIEKVEYAHPIFKPYLEDTFGCVLYQEQVMEIGRNVGDLDWGQVTALRKAMSKSLGKEYFDQFGDPWKKAAIKKGVPKDKADKIWDDLCAYGAWSFNKSHSVAYGYVSYWCCWLKAHHPFEFAAATLTHVDDPEKQIQLLREMVAEGYEYIAVDADRSTDRWAVAKRGKKKVLIGPLQNIKGIGPKSLSEIMADRARNRKIKPRLEKLLESAKTQIDSLFPIRDAINRVMPDPTERNIYTQPTPICELVPKKNDYHVTVFCRVNKISPFDENEAVRVARRGGKLIEDEVNGTHFLRLQIEDDTGLMNARIERKKFKTLAQPIIDRGRPGKALYAFRGRMPRMWGDGKFRQLDIEVVRYLGDMDLGTEQEQAARETEKAA